MIIENDSLEHKTNGIIYVEDFSNLKNYSSYMLPNNIVVGSYEYNVFKDYRKYSGYSYEMYYLDDDSNIHQMTYNIQNGNGLVIDENGLVSVNIDDYTIQNSKDGLVVNSENLTTAYSNYQKGLIKGDNKPYRNFLSEYKDKGFVGTNNGIVRLNHGFVHDLLEIKNLEKDIDVEIENINTMLENMFKSRKYAIGDLLYYDFDTNQLVDTDNTNTIPYMICVIASDTTDDKIPRFIKLEDKNYHYPISKFYEEENGLEGLNSYISVPIFEVPWSYIRTNSKIVFGSYGFIALDRYDWYENFVNHFNYEEHYYCNANPKYTEWYLDASFITYNNPGYKDWTILAGGLYTFNLSDEIRENITTFEDLTDNICVKYNNIIKHYKIDYKYDKKNNKYVSVTDAEPISGTGGVYVLSEKAVAENIEWENILKFPYINRNSTWKLNSAFLPYREEYNYAAGKQEKNYISVDTLVSLNNSNELYGTTKDSVSYYDWDWKQNAIYYYDNTEINYNTIINNCISAYIFTNSYFIDRTGIPNIGLKVEYSWTDTNNKIYKTNYEYIICKSLYNTYKFTSKDVEYTSVNKTSKYYTESKDYTTRLYDSSNHYVNWKSSYINPIWIPNCIYKNVSGATNPKIKLTAYNLNYLNLNDDGIPMGFYVGEFTLNIKNYKDSLGNITSSYLSTILDEQHKIEIISGNNGNGLYQNNVESNKLIKQLRDYRLAIDGPVYFKPDLTYITTQQSENEFLLHDEYKGHIINNILDYRSTFIDYYLFANLAEYEKGDCNLLSIGCIWLYDPYKILWVYENKDILISLNIYSSNEEIAVQDKLFKFKIENNSDSSSYIYPDWYDVNTSEYLLHCEQRDIKRITFNYAIDYDYYNSNRRIEELDDVPLAPEGTVLYVETVKEEEEETTPTITIPDNPGTGGGSTEEEECNPKIPASCSDMWIVNDYVEPTVTEDGHVFLHDMSIGIKFKETDWGSAKLNTGSKVNLRLGKNGNIYLLYFRMSTSDSNNNSYVAFTYRNYSDNGGYVLKLCVNETLMMNKNADYQSWTADTNASIPTSRNADLLDFSLGSESVQSFFVNPNLKFDLVGIGVIRSSTQMERIVIPVSEGSYSISTYYENDRYKDVQSTINMTERVTVWTAYKYLRTFGERPVLNHFDKAWPSDGPLEPGSPGETVTLSAMYMLSTTTNVISYDPTKDTGNIHNQDGKAHSKGLNISNTSSLCETSSGNNNPINPTPDPSYPATPQDLSNLIYVNGEYIPATIVVNGTTYYYDKPSCPGDDYDEVSVTQTSSKGYTYTYYAWVKHVKTAEELEAEEQEKQQKLQKSIDDISTILNKINTTLANANWGCNCSGNCGTGGNTSGDDSPSGDSPSGDDSPSGGNISVSAPTISSNNNASVFTDSITLTMNCSTSGSTIYYTTDGTTPSNTSTQYTNSIQISDTDSTIIDTIIVKAIAYVGTSYSSVTTKYFTKQTSNINVDSLNSPTISSSEGDTFTNNTIITIEGTPDGVTIYYQILNKDTGNIIDSGQGVSPVSFQLAQTANVSASSACINTNNDPIVSALTTKLFTKNSGGDTTPDVTPTTPDVTPITPSAPSLPTFTIGTTNYNHNSTVSFADNVDILSINSYNSDQIRYNFAYGTDLDVTPEVANPTISFGTEYNGTIKVIFKIHQQNGPSQDTGNKIFVIKAIGINTTNDTTGGVSTFTIKYEQKVATPVISFDNTTNTMTITCDTSGATIYYTINGNEPTTSSTLYNSPMQLASSRTVKARAYKDGWTDSDVASKYCEYISNSSTDIYPYIGNNPLLINGMSGYYEYDTNSSTVTLYFANVSNNVVYYVIAPVEVNNIQPNTQYTGGFDVSKIGTYDYVYVYFKINNGSVQTIRIHFTT